MPSGQRLPKRLHIGALTYTVSDDKTRMLEACREQGTDLLGHTDHARATILLERKAADCVKRDTLLHEALHVITDTCGLAAEWGEKDEGYIRRITPHLLAALRDNPELVAYLVAD